MTLGRPAGAALGRRLDRLPGRAALAQPGAAGRPPDRRADPGARARPARGRGRPPGRRAARPGRAERATARRAYPHQLSGGQKQRVMIAMALACRPQLIVADEPTTALDVMVQAQILDLLGDLVRDLGVGLLIISHDLSVLADVCDRVLVMYAGRVVEAGTAEQVFTDPLHPYAAALSGAFPRIGDPAARYAPAGLAGDPPDPRELPEGCSFAPRCPRAVDALHARRAAAGRGRSRAGRWPASGWVSRDRARRASDAAARGARRHGRVRHPHRPRRPRPRRRRPVGPPRRGPRDRRRVRLRQDHAGPDA